jgi:hypothetical protein
MQLRPLALACVLFVMSSPTKAMVGGAAPADPTLARHLVMIVSARGFCTGAAIARDLVLTAAHCVPPGADYKLIETDAGGTPQLRDIARIARHPQYSADNFERHRVTADLALLKLARALPASTVPAPLGLPQKPVVPGDRFTVAGYGLGTVGEAKSGGRARAASLLVTGQPGTLQIRLVDETTRGERPGLGSCDGDSGAPAFDLAAVPTVIGVVSVATGARLAAGCGGLTIVTPLARYRDWLVKTARELGSPLP